MKRAPVARILFPFASGSVFGYCHPDPANRGLVILLCAGLWLLLVIFFCLSRRCSGLIQGLFCTTALALFAVTGYVTGLVTRPVDPGFPVAEEVVVLGEVLEDPVLRKNRYVFKLRLQVIVTMRNRYQSKCILKTYMEVPSGPESPQAGERWQLTGQLVAITNSGNPGEPDYESIMKRNNCWYLFFAEREHFVQSELGMHEAPGRRGTISATTIRNMVSGWWTGDEEEISLLKAVCLGDRSGLTDDLRQDYSDAGGMHLLAVSGLHVGLIWWVLHHSLGWMVRLFGKELFRALIVVVLLWFFAFVTGFSSSVCRSVTMFTFFSAARMMEQRTHSLNGILVSAFVLILINPGRMLDVGFQLSYAAITGIVTIQPVLSSLLKVKNRILRWTWDASLVSLSAQLTTAPLVIFYFHRLPVYALATNLVAVPLLSIMIAAFMFSIPFMATGFLTLQVSWLLTGLAGMMNRTMDLIGSMPGSVIGNLYMDLPTLCMVNGMVFFMTMVLHDLSNLSKYLFILFSSLLFAWNAWSALAARSTSELIVCHFNGGSLVSFREGRSVDHYMWSAHQEGLSRMEDYLELAWGQPGFRNTLHPFTEAKSLFGSVSGSIPLMQGVWLIGNDSTMGMVFRGSVDGFALDVHAVTRMDFLLLSREPWMIAGSKILEESGCKVIIDGSNSVWFRKRMDQILLDAFDTSVDGAFRK